MNHTQWIILRSSLLGRTEKGAMGKAIVEDTFESTEPMVIYNSARIEDQYDKIYRISSGDITNAFLTGNSTGISISFPANR